MREECQKRLLGIFYRGLLGEELSVRKLADEYGVSTKSITRTINDLKSFLSESRDLIGDAEFKYNNQNHCYSLCMDEMLSAKELFSIIEVLIGARAFSKTELLIIIDKLKKSTVPDDRNRLNELISNEIYHYSEVKHDCKSVQDNLWLICNCIYNKKEITIDYYRMDRNFITRRIRPVSIMFTDYYFYLIAFETEAESVQPLYFRIDRIKSIREHRENTVNANLSFDEGLLRRRSLFMWPGKLRKIVFEFTGPSVQAVLDKLPTAKIIAHNGNKYTIEAEAYGDGIKMWLLSQGSWVKVIAPDEFVGVMVDEIEKMSNLYK